MVTVTVRAPSRTYDVVVGAGVLARADEHLPDLGRAEKAFVVADDGVASRFLGPLATGLAARGLAVERLPVPAGEAAKTMAKEGISMLPVVDDGRYVGLFTRDHVVTALDRLEFGGGGA